MTKVRRSGGRLMLSADQVLEYAGPIYWSNAILSYNSVVVSAWDRNYNTVTRKIDEDEIVAWRKAQMLQLVDLGDDWDGYGALRPSPDALKAASEFLGAWQSEWIRPVVVASTEGNVVLEWHQNDLVFILEFEAPGDVTAYVRHGEDECEGTVSDNVDAVRKALARVAYVA